MSENQRKMGDGENYGVTTGLTRGQFITAVFDNQMVAKLSDTELVSTLRAEFPQSRAKYESYISMYRNKYNRGGFPCQAEPPSVPIPSFDEEGKVIEKKTGPPPRMAWEEKEERK